MITSATIDYSPSEKEVYTFTKKLSLLMDYCEATNIFYFATAKVFQSRQNSEVREDGEFYF